MHRNTHREETFYAHLRMSGTESLGGLGGGSDASSTGTAATSAAIQYSDQERWRDNHRIINRNN